MKNLKKALSIFAYFFRIGWFTFGGGWSIVAQIQKDYVEDKHELEAQDLLDIVSVGRSIPGTMIGNVAYLFGYHQAGIAGGIAGVLGIITPPMIILTVVTFFYNNVKDNLYIGKALTGVRSVVAPVIFSAVLKLHKGAFPNKLCYVLCGLGCILSLFTNVSCILIVCIGIVVGIVMNHKKGGVSA